MKVNDEKKYPHPDPDLDPDPFVRGMDPRIRIRIHTKMSWIRNTVIVTQKIFKIIRCANMTTWLLFQTEIKALEWQAHL